MPRSRPSSSGTTQSREPFRRSSEPSAVRRRGRPSSVGTIHTSCPWVKETNAPPGATATPWRGAADPSVSRRGGPSPGGTQTSSPRTTATNPSPVGSGIQRGAPWRPMPWTPPPGSGTSPASAPQSKRVSTLSGRAGSRASSRSPPSTPARRWRRAREGCQRQSGREGTQRLLCRTSSIPRVRALSSAPAKSPAAARSRRARREQRARRTSGG